MHFVLDVDVRRSADKLLLIMVARSADRSGVASPTHKRLMRETSLDRKTVIRGLQRLCADGFLSDIGRRGDTGQVVVYLVLGLGVRAARRRGRPRPAGPRAGASGGAIGGIFG